MSAYAEIRNAAEVIAVFLGGLCLLVALLAFMEQSVLARRKRWRR